jgi:hypothetical protein
VDRRAVGGGAGREPRHEDGLLRGRRRFARRRSAGLPAALTAPGRHGGRHLRPSAVRRARGALHGGGGCGRRTPAHPHRGAHRPLHAVPPDPAGHPRAHPLRHAMGGARAPAEQRRSDGRGCSRHDALVAHRRPLAGLRHLLGPHGALRRCRPPAARRREAGRPPALRLRPRAPVAGRTHRGPRGGGLRGLGPLGHHLCADAGQPDRPGCRPPHRTAGDGHAHGGGRRGDRARGGPQGLVGGRRPPPAGAHPRGCGGHRGCTLHAHARCEGGPRRTRGGRLRGDREGPEEPDVLRFAGRARGQAEGLGVAGASSAAPPLPLPPLRRRLRPPRRDPLPRRRAGPAAHGGGLRGAGAGRPAAPAPLGAGARRRLVPHHSGTHRPRRAHPRPWDGGGALPRPLVDGLPRVGHGADHGHVPRPAVPPLRRPPHPHLAARSSVRGWAGTWRPRRCSSSPA